MKKSPYLLIPGLQDAGRILHAFTTRENGLGARSSGFKSPGDWDLMARAFSIRPERLVTVNQVHGDVVVVVDEKNFGDVKALKADALITRSPELAIGVETADCVPILLYDPDTPAVAAVHAGWRSTVQKIVRKTVQLMQREFGSDISRMIAAIGPAIGPECYEVDEPVMDPVKEAFPFWEEAASLRSAGRWSLDLVKLSRLELTRFGLKADRVHSLGLCTSCSREQFYSFRAEGRTGRMLSVIMIKACSHISACS